MFEPVLAGSIVVQLLAAFLSLRLIRTTRWWMAWGAVATAMVLMAVRRGITLYQHVSPGRPDVTPDLSAELVALLISVLMLAGVFLLGPHFRGARGRERRFSAFMEHLPTAACIVDRQGRWIYANGTAEEWLGLAPGEWRGQRARELLPDDAAREFQEQQCRVRETLEPVSSETTLETPAGKRVLRTQQFPILDDDGELDLVGAVARDVTETRSVEQRERRLAAAIEQAAELVMITDPDGIIEYVNPAFEEITGYTEEEAVGRDTSLLKAEEQDESFYRDLWQTLEAGEAWSGRFVNRRKDGELYRQDTSISPVVGSSGATTGYVAVGHDVSHLIELEEHLRHAERMEALGTLTGGIAHDFNNILTVVLSNAELLNEAGAADDEEATEALADLVRTAKAGADLVRKLLIFSRREQRDFQPLDLAVELEELVPTLRRLIPESIEIRLETEEDLPPVRADSGALHQIFMNVASNARDAMSGEGRLHIEASATRLTDDDRLRHGSLEPGEYVVVAVSDTGRGMDEETRRRIFEPFFTTKESGQGTGLGLATVYSLIQQHQGTINVYSEPGVGTTFKIYIPVTEEEVATEETDGAGSDDHANAVGAGERILVVEDDDALRRAAQRMLERMGFEVSVARDGEEGWEVFRDASEPFDLVVSDLVMPRLGVVELLARIRERAPDLRLVLTSGYSETDERTGGHDLDSDVGYLSKPWTVTELGQRQSPTNWREPLLGRLREPGRAGEDLAPAPLQGRLSASVTGLHRTRRSWSRSGWPAGPWS